TFRLRAGIRYSNGQPVRPEDVRRALERVFILNRGGGPAAYFYSGIVGATFCERHPQSCTLSRGIVTNNQAGTVTYHLTAPDPDFLDKLAIPFADAVPADTPDHQVSAGQMPATGPYMTRSLQPTRAWVLVRNPRFRQWSAQAQPDGFPDQIVLRLGAAPGAAVDAVEHGHADVLFSPPPVSRIHELTTRYANLLHTYSMVTDPAQPLMPGPAAGRYVVRVLRQIGYRASLRAIASPQTYWNTIDNSHNNIQIGEFRWSEDYPAPWDFFGPLLSCHAFLPGNPANLNDSEFCDPRIDAQFRQALAAQARSPDAARLLWASIDREIAGQAPWVPVYNPRALVVLSARVGNYQFHP